ncbi:MAG: ribulose-phosphate 3-epimerase [Clostridia bacterium]|nr:ribulose-phosphate 3-epimerase [Clostridia bacterium]
MKVAPSVLACDFSKMGEEILKVNEAKADMIHLDVMDGNFVPNISFGPAVIKSIRKYTDILFDVHLMIQEPKRYINDYVKAGAENITFHVEAEYDVKGTIEDIKNQNVKASLSVRPKTPIEAVFPYLDDIFMVLIMTVEPGFGGQSFMPDMMEKVKKLRAEIDRRNLDVLIQVDGGINIETSKVAKEAGVDVCVAGTALFGAESMTDAVKDMQNI